jgi:hypothetical protein
MWSVYFLYMYGYEALKPAKVILRKGEGRRITEGINLIGVHCTHIWKCHN